MARNMLLVFACILLVGAGVVYGYTPYVDPAKHPGALCTDCHTRFVEDRPELKRFNPCYEKPCHRSKPGGRMGNARYSTHIQKKVCKNCHVQKDGEYDIHEIHFNFSSLLPPWKIEYPENVSLREEGVECAPCHAYPGGYNTSKVSVPLWGEALKRMPVSGVVRPPWDNKCSFCHLSAKKAVRLHDVHKPVIMQACPVCHTSKVFKQENLVGRVAGAKGIGEEIAPRIEFLPIREFRSYFNNIVGQMQKMYIFLIGVKSTE
ncbi:MAG: hypothetical protein V3T58_04755 [Candidatus Hydrothermarchaeales archaeon]